MELRERGLTEEFIEDHLQITDNSWLIALARILQKRFKNKKTTDKKFHYQQQRFLYYRGFTEEQIERVLTEPL